MAYRGSDRPPLSSLRGPAHAVSTLAIVATFACGATNMAKSAANPRSRLAATTTPTEREGGRCEGTLGPSPFRDPRATHILIADFYGVSGTPSDRQFADRVTRQIDVELTRFREEELAKMPVEVPLEAVEFRRLRCFVESHEHAERVARAWSADLVIWGRSYCDVLPEAQRSIQIHQEISTGRVTATQGASVNIGSVQVAPTKPYAVCPRATLHRSGARLRSSDNSVEFETLAHLDLPSLASTAPFQLIHFTLGLHFFEREEPWIAARFFERSSKEILSPAGQDLSKLQLYLGRAYLHLPDGEARAIEYSQAALRSAQGTGTPTEAALLNNIGRALEQQGKYAQAIEYFERALLIDEKALGKNHPTTASILNNIGAALQRRGLYAAAIGYCQRALSITEATLGKDHTATARVLNNLGDALQHQGLYAEAARYYRRALTIDEKTLGNDHPSIATSLNNVGAALYGLRQHALALTYYRRALAIDQKVLGDDHPATARDLNNIGAALHDQGQYADAIECYQRALAIDEKAFGSDHPATARDLNNIGAAFYDQGKYAEAIEHYQRALAIDGKAFGSDHPATARDLNNIGAARREQGRYPEALEHYQRALAIDEKVLGNDHPSTAIRLNNIGVVLRAQGKYPSAIAYFERSLRILESRLGSDHPSARTTRESLARTLADGAGRAKAKRRQGPVVSRVLPDSPAQAAGLRLGDWIARYAGRDVSDSNALSELVAQAESSTAPADLDVIRRGKRLRIHLRNGPLGVELVD